MRPRVRRVLLALVTALGLVATPLLVAGPAQAHDQLLQSDPKDGSAVPQAPQRITLTFSGELQDPKGSKANQIKVTDRDGNEVTRGSVEVKGTKLSRALKPLPKGTYDVEWSALSSDGHRVHGDGNLAFTVTRGAQASDDPAQGSDAASSPAADASSQGGSQGGETAGSAGSLDTQSSAAGDQVGGTSQTNLIMWIVGGFLVLAIILGIILQVTRRPKRRHGAGGADGAAADDATRDDDAR